METMGWEVMNEPIAPPKLSLFSLPANSKTPEAAGMLTPPPQALASVPFQWEEAPGKPRDCAAAASPKPMAVRCLELPPRLMAAEAAASPTTVLGGPQVGRSLSFSFSLRKGSFKSPAAQGAGADAGEDRDGGGENWRVREVGGSFDSTPSMMGSTVKGRGCGGEAAAKTVRLRRTRSLRCLTTRSQLLASIYESFKQAVPWRSGPDKLRKATA